MPAVEDSLFQYVPPVTQLQSCLLYTSPSERPAFPWREGASPCAPGPSGWTPLSWTWRGSAGLPWWTAPAGSGWWWSCLLYTSRLKAGEPTLSQALREQAAVLEADRGDLERYAQVCLEMSRTEVDFGTLDPEPWLKELESRPLPPSRQVDVDKRQPTTRRTWSPRPLRASSP